MADTMDIPREEVLLGRCCECGIGLDPRTHPTMTCVNCLQARVLIAASRGAAAPSRHRRASSPGEEVVGGLFFDFPMGVRRTRRGAPRRALAVRHAGHQSFFMKTGLLPKATALMSDGEVSTTDERVRRHVEVLGARH